MPNPAVLLPSHWTRRGARRRGWCSGGDFAQQTWLTAHTGVPAPAQRAGAAPRRVAPAPPASLRRSFPDLRSAASENRPVTGAAPATHRCDPPAPFSHRGAGRRSAARHRSCALPQKGIPRRRSPLRSAAAAFPALHPSTPHPAEKCAGF